MGVRSCERIAVLGLQIWISSLDQHRNTLLPRNCAKWLVLARQRHQVFPDRRRTCFLDSKGFGGEIEFLFFFLQKLWFFCLLFHIEGSSFVNIYVLFWLLQDPRQGLVVGLFHFLPFDRMLAIVVLLENAF